MEITGRQSARAFELRPLDQWLRRFADGSKDIVTLHDRFFRTVHVNPTYLHVVGHDRNTVVGRPVGVSLVATDAPVMGDARQRLMDEGTSQRFEVRAYDSTGAERWFDIEMMVVPPLFDTNPPPGEEDDEAVHYMAIGRDITRHKRELQNRSQTHRYLDEPGSPRRDRGQRLALLGEVAAGIAHEISQPVAVIGLAAENALQQLTSPSGDPEEAATKLRRIIGQTERIGAVIGHAMGYARCDSGAVTAMDHAVLIRQSLILVERRLTSAGVTLKIIMPDDLPRLLCVPVLFEQALMNVVRNACDAYDAHSEITHRPLEIAGRRDGANVVISVTDAAGGIAEAVLVRVFDPGFTTKPVGVGTGLGLPISRAALQDVGGDLTVFNVRGGARFNLIVPADTSLRPVIAAPA